MKKLLDHFKRPDCEIDTEKDYIKDRFGNPYELTPEAQERVEKENEWESRIFKPMPKKYEPYAGLVTATIILGCLMTMIYFHRDMSKSVSLQMQYQKKSNEQQFNFHKESITEIKTAIIKLTEIQHETMRNVDRVKYKTDLNSSRLDKIEQ